MLHRLKDYFRRRALARRGVFPQLEVNTFTAGERSGVWTVCPDLLSSESVVYSFGVGDNLAWERALIDKFGLTIHAFDPTPASVAWVAGQKLPSRLLFHPVGLAGYDGAMRFVLPQRGSRFNFRPQMPTSAPRREGVKAPVSRLVTHARQLGHSRLDVVKIDIEGGEYAVLDDVFNGTLVPRQLLLEFHHHFPGVGIERTEHAVRALRNVGYRIFHMSLRGLEISFLHEPS